MPLTKRQFDLGVDEEGENIMRQVYELLAAHSDLAYSIQELHDAIRGPLLVDTRWTGRVMRAVEVLVGIGAVEEREVAGNVYFAFLQEFDTGTWMSAKHAFPRP
jgi:hypothetical protein